MLDYGLWLETLFKFVLSLLYLIPIAVLILVVFCPVGWILGKSKQRKF